MRSSAVVSRGPGASSLAASMTLASNKISALVDHHRYTVCRPTPARSAMPFMVIAA